MKKLFILGAILGSALLTNAQVSFGPIVGVGVQGPRTYSITDNSSTTVTTTAFGNTETETTPDFNISTAPTPKAGLSYKVGVQAKIDINDYLAISPGIAFQNMSSKIDYVFGSYKSSVNYLSVPVLVQGQYPINDMINIGLGIGPEFNFLLGGKHKITPSFGPSSTVKIKAKSKVGESDDKVNHDENNDNDVDFQRPVNISLLVAPFVQFKFGKMSLLVSPTYYIGLTNISSPMKYSSSTTETAGFGPFSVTTTETRNVDVKESIKTGGFGFNVSLLFGGDGK